MMAAISQTHTYEAVKICDDVYWVGAVDWDIRNFHGYLTGRGTTYNAYLIMAERPTLIDTVKAPFFGEMMSRIASVIDPAKIEYIVSNHSEMDHTGALPATIEAVAPEKVYASEMGRKTLTAHFHMPAEQITAVGTGDSIDLGNMQLAFVETRMCHWPDSMVSYLPQRELLFSQDGFGMHLASYERFADELPQDILRYEAAKYYANILLHLSKFIDKALASIEGLGVKIGMVAPDHGPIWRRQEDIDWIISSYARWSAQRPVLKAVVVYDSMWGSTAAMARAIGDGLAAGGVHTKLMNMSSAHRSDVITELLEAGALLIGSPTMNNNIFPTIADVGTYIKGLRPRNLIGAAFGSHGWSGEAPKHLTAMMRDMGVDVIADPLRITYVPDDVALAQCREFGLKTAEFLKARCEGKAAPSPHPAAEPTTRPQQKCVIDINNGARRLDVTPGRSLFETLREHDIFLPTICGGEGLCGLCKVTVSSGGGEPNATEKGHLSAEQLAAGLRLGCQVQVTGDLAIGIPAQSLDARPFRGEVQAIEDLTYDIKLFRFSLAEPKKMSFTPGQYIKLDVPESIDASAASRAFSIASRPADSGTIELIVRLNPNGVCTNWMFRRMKVGEQVALSGPYGEFGLTDSATEMVWVAGGSGLSAFWSILRDAIDKGMTRKCTLYFGARTTKDLYLIDELQKIADEHEWFSIIPALSEATDEDKWTGRTGLITEVLDADLAEAADMEAYLCGPPGMLKAAREVLARKGIKPENIRYDEFTPSALAAK